MAFCNKEAGLLRFPCRRTSYHGLQKKWLSFFGFQKQTPGLFWSSPGILQTKEAHHHLSASFMIHFSLSSLLKADQCGQSR
ncbi:hypothetical protein HPP92_000474 [Vanilla planifolia]|uniref:Uncharacterized protein n=1 Tax=Vanilla planifolia TaxID=51239 RepID=A0A835S1D6_VANPL|nr:hypothetical protein HPP92_000474 [Vanilla planifolia]